MTANESLKQNLIALRDRSQGLDKLLIRKAINRIEALEHALRQIQQLSEKQCPPKNN